MPGADDTLDVHRRISRRDRRRIRGSCSHSSSEARARPRRLLRVFAGRRRGGQRAARSSSGRAARRAARSLHGDAGSHQRAPVAGDGSARRSTCWSTRTMAHGRCARSAADAPEIDGTVAVADGAALAVGEFAGVRITRRERARSLRRSGLTRRALFLRQIGAAPRRAARATLLKAVAESCAPAHRPSVKLRRSARRARRSSTKVPDAAALLLRKNFDRSAPRPDARGRASRHRAR